MYDDKAELDNILKKDESYFLESEEKTSHLIEQPELNDLVRDLHLSKEHAKVLGYRLAKWHLLATGKKVTIFKNRNQELSSFFTLQDNIRVCLNPNSGMEKLEFADNPNEWRLFIYSSKINLKAVLLYNGNRKLSIPLAHAVDMKETYENL